jgi:competence protein ComEC
VPLIAIAVASYAGGLILGFAALHTPVAVGAAALVACAYGLRRGTLAAFGFLIVAGDLVATDRRWADRACLKRLATATMPVRVRLVADAAPGSLARGRTDDAGCEIRISVVVAEGGASAGAVVEVTGTFVQNGGALLARGARLSVVRGPGVLARLKARASRALQRDFGADAPLAKALLIAETADLGPEVRDRFATAGLVHILSISGLHVTIVAAAVVLVLEAARLPRRVALISACVLTAFYVALIGAPPPAVRSAVMFGAVAVSRLMQRPTSAWAALALGAAWPIPGDPRVVLDIGWQLTIAGMVALIAAGDVNRRFITGRFDGWRGRLASEIVTGVMATLVTAPLVAWYFGRTSLVAPLANIAANPIANVLQPALFLALALGWWPAASSWVADACRPGLRALDAVATQAASLPGADFGVAPTLTGALLAMLAIAAVVAASRARRPMAPLSYCVGLLAVAIWMPLLPGTAGELELHVIDVGQGDALALRTPRGRWVLIDAGRSWRGGDAGRRTIVPYVRRRGGGVELFVLTHPHEDHVGGASSLLDALKPRQYWDAAYVEPNTSYRASLAVAERRRITWRRVRPGDTLRVDNVLLRALAPDSTWTAAQRDPNEASTVVMVEYGAIRMLLTGDAEVDEERWLVERWGAAGLRADVLKAGHHGSRTSSSAPFLDAVRPRLAIISSGAGNVYRHPHQATLDAFAGRRVIVARTDELGSVVVSTDGRRIRLAGADGAWTVPP